MLEVCSGVTNEMEKDGGYKRSGRTLVGRAESDGSPAMCKVFERMLGITLECLKLQRVNQCK